MADDIDSLDDFEPDQKKRIEKLKKKVDEIAGRETAKFESEDVRSDMSESFWQYIVDYETAPMTTEFQLLEDAGVILPPPEEMDDETLSKKLWALIGRLAKMRTFVENTNHLSDRELYEYLWRDTLREERPNIKFNKYSAWHMDMIGSGSEEHIYLWMKYYADEETRRDWLERFPDYEMPSHEDPPYDRDRFIPEATYANPDDDPNYPKDLYNFDDDDELETKM